MLADIADVTEPQTRGSFALTLAWRSAYRLHQAFSMAATETSAGSRKRSHVRSARRGFRVSGWASGPYIHSMAKVLETPWYKVPVATARLFFWMNVDFWANSNGGRAVRL